MNQAENLLSFSRELQKVADLPTTLELANTFISAHTRYRACWALLRTQDERHLELIGNPTPKIKGAHTRMAAIALEQDPLLRHFFTAKAPFFIPDLRAEPLADQDQVEHFGNRTLIAVPMLPMGNRVGALFVGTFSEQGVLPPTPDEFDLVVRVASLLTLVVSRIRAEERSRELATRSHANQRLEALGQLAGEIAHDFTNIVMAIHGNAEFALRLLEGHPATSYVREVQASAARATKLSRQLLTFSKGRLLQVEPLSVYEVTDAVRSMLTRLLPTNIELTVNVPSNLPFVTADRGQLEQVVMNLMLNARDAMSQGGELTVSAGLTPAGSDAFPGQGATDYVYIAVADTGSGIPEEAQTRVFDPFFSTKHSTEGTGLGLSVVSSIMAQHQGHVAFETGADGTTFRAHLPVAPATTSAKDPVGPKRVLAPRAKVRLLVVDDQASIRQLLGRSFRRAGYEVGLCADGEDALTYLKLHPDTAVVLTDMAMPKMSGLDLTLQLATLRHPPQVILMSGYSPGRIPKGPVHVLNKPFTPTEALAVIQRLLPG